MSISWNAILNSLRNAVPPDPISSVYVETETYRKFEERAIKILKGVKEGNFGLMSIVAPRGYGKTGLIKYFGEKYTDEYFFIYETRCPTSRLGLFRSFINRLGKKNLTNIITNLFTDPLDAYRTIVDENGHVGVAVALAGLLEKDDNCWIWLSRGSSRLYRLKKSGLTMQRNIRENEAIFAMKTITSLIGRIKPVIYALDEVESAYRDIKGTRQEESFLTMWVDIINEAPSYLFLLLSFTRQVYNALFESMEKAGSIAESTGAKRRIESAYYSLEAPNLNEFRRMFEKSVLIPIENAYGVKIDRKRLESIWNDVEKCLKKTREPTPHDLIRCSLTLLETAAMKLKGIDDDAKKLEKIGERFYELYSGPMLGVKFQEAFDKFLKQLDAVESVYREVSARVEVAKLREYMQQIGLSISKAEESVDFQFNFINRTIYAEVCITKRGPASLPLNKVIALCAKVLYNPNTYGIFIVHGFNRFTLKHGAWEMFTYNQDLIKRVFVINLDRSQCARLLGLLDMKDDLSRFAKMLDTMIGLTSYLKQLIEGKLLLPQEWGA